MKTLSIEGLPILPPNCDLLLEPVEGRTGIFTLTLKNPGEHHIQSLIANVDDSFLRMQAESLIIDYETAMKKQWVTDAGKVKVVRKPTSEEV